jgi:hypothetical protein
MIGSSKYGGIDPKGFHKLGKKRLFHGDEAAFR